MKIRILITAAILFAAGNSFAAAVAHDNASAWAYNASLPDDWVTGDNGGHGWGAWTLNTTGIGGHFIGSSTGNGDGVDNGSVNGAFPDGDINSMVGPNPDQSGDPDPNMTVGRAWGMYNSGGVTNAFRSFSDPMVAGQTFSMDFDNGHVGPGGTVGLGLLNSAGATLWEIYFKGGFANYFNRDASGEVATSVGYGDEGLNVNFTLTGATAYTMILTRRDGVAQTINGTLLGELDQNIAQVRAFNANAGGGGPHDAFYNNMTLVPEPASSAFGLLGAILLLRRRRN